MGDTTAPTELTITMDIRASPDRVWTVLRDIDRWPEWTPTVTRVQRRDNGPLAVGASARLHQPKLTPAEWRVTRLEVGHGFTWESRHPGVRVTGGHWIEPLGTGSRVTLSLHFGGWLGPLIARLFRNLNQRYLALEAEGLRQRCERPDDIPVANAVPPRPR